MTENCQKSKERVMHRADLQPSPLEDPPSMMSIFMNTFEFQAYLQHSWPQELAHLKLSSELFNCIPPEARVQFSKNRRELANRLLEKASSNPVSTKGERGESSAQTGRPWSRDTPPKKSFQPKNSALKTEIKAEQEESSGQEDDSDGNANDIQAAFNFLQTAYRDQHGFLGRLETTEHSTGQALNINGHSLVQVRSLMSDRQDHGLTCMDGCANAGVISTWTHHIDHTVPNRKANLLGAQSNFKSKGLSIGTGITTLLSPLDPNTPVCLLVYHEACIHDDPTSLYSNYQMREYGIVVDDVATKHVKDSQGNKGTQSIHIPNGGPKLPLAIADALPVMTIRKPTQEELDTLPKHVLTSIEPWNPKEHHHDFEPVVLNAEISPENSENSDEDSSVPDLLTRDDDCSDSSSECSDIVEDLEDEGEQFQDAMEDIPTAEEPEVTATPSPDPSEKPANFCFFDPSDDLSDDAVKGKAVQLSIDDCSKHIREVDIHTMLMELKDEELYGRDQEFDSITCARGLRNMVQRHLKDPHLDPTNLRAPSDTNPDDTTPELQKEAIPESLPKESKVWKPGESGATDPDSEAPETGEQHPSQPSPVIPEVTDPDIPPPMVDPEPLEQDQVRHKFARALPKVDDPAALRPKLGYVSFCWITETLKCTTQLARRVTKFPMVRHLRSSFKWLTDQRINEKVSTDTMFANVPSVEGYSCAQVHFGMTSHMINIYGMKKESDFYDVHRDFFRNEGVPSVLH